MQKKIIIVKPLINFRKTWQTINDTLNRKRRSKDFPQEFILSNGKIISDHKQIANEFNDFFISIGEPECQNKDATYTFSKYLPEKANTNLLFKTVTEEEIGNIINSLKPKVSTGIDSISNKLLKEIKEAIVIPLTIIINQMLMTGIFPNLLKISKVIPLYKKDDNTNMSNYKPIALLPSISKIFEKVILLQLTKYLDENNLICEKQYGFRKNHSTEYAALHIVDFLNYQLDANKIPVSVYLDLSKAFDSLSHKILLDKIKHLGITGLAYKLLQSYLLNRQQYVAFKNCRSDLKFINNGVPQGSILGPMLFLIYINDFPNASKLFNFIMYADDTSLFCCLEGIQSPHKEYTLNQELQKVYKWLLANKLKLNVAKTKYMIFSKRNKNINPIYLNINNNVIDHVSSFNFLGLHLNSKLTWNTHMEEISKKISRTIGVLKKLQLTVPKNILLSIYNALILPQINYCLLCWGYDTSEIFLLQKKAIRIISGANIKSHTEPIFKLYNLLKIEDIYKSKLLILYYKILKLSSPRYFDTFIPKNSAGVSRYPIRNPRWQPPAHRHTYITSTSRYQLAVLLNSINDTHDMMSNVIEHIGIISLLSFKATIKRYLNNKYSYFCSIINCFICKQYH